MNIHVKPDEAAPAMSDSAVKTVNLALQGGGAHGAFTWGVLDRILEDERIAIEGISATSAGAMNAAVLAYGLTIGGREGARTGADQFLARVAHAAVVQPAAADDVRPARAQSRARELAGAPRRSTS